MLHLSLYVFVVVFATISEVVAIGMLADATQSSLWTELAGLGIVGVFLVFVAVYLAHAAYGLALATAGDSESLRKTTPEYFSRPLRHNVWPTSLFLTICKVVHHIGLWCGVLPIVLVWLPVAQRESLLTFTLFVFVCGILAAYPLARDVSRRANCESTARVLQSLGEQIDQLKTQMLDQCGRFAAESPAFDSPAYRERIDAIVSDHTNTNEAKAAIRNLDTLKRQMACSFAGSRVKAQLDLLRDRLPEKDVRRFEEANRAVVEGRDPTRAYNTANMILQQLESIAAEYALPPAVDLVAEKEAQLADEKKARDAALNTITEQRQQLEAERYAKQQLEELLRQHPDLQLTAAETLQHLDVRKHEYLQQLLNTRQDAEQPAKRLQDAKTIRFVEKTLNQSLGDLEDGQP